MILRINLIEICCFQDRGLDASIYQNVCKLHLTIGCLVLLDDAEIRRAADVLEGCRKELVE